MEANIKTFQNIPVSSIQSFLSNNQEPFQSSQLYSSQRDETFINEDLRKSIFRTIQDPKLFDLIDTEIVQNLLNNDPENRTHNFMLRRNDVTHIKYSKGGFFKKHRDYLSTTSNFVEEFTFLLCVTPTDALGNEDNLAADGGTGGGAVKGGETKLFGYGTSKCYDTSTPGTGLLFRKDLEHEGCELIQGEKHIITLNLYATRKETNDQVLLVTFPNEGTDDTDAAQDTDDDQKMKKMKSLLHIASNESLSYVIPVQNLFGMLEAHVRFANKQHRERLGLINDGDDEDDGDGGNSASSSSKPPVIHYECKDFDFETFGVIVKIFNNTYVEEEDLVMARDCMDYFGPISTENILVNLSLDPEEIRVNKDTATTMTNIDTTNDDATKINAANDDVNEVDEHRKEESDAKEDQQVQKKTKLKYKDLLDDKSFDPDIIVCENEARMHAVANVAHMLGEPFVPFKIAFVEGLICDDMEVIVNVPMTAAACVLGDYNNIFSIWKLCQRFFAEDVSPDPLNRVNLEHNYWAKIPDEYKDKYKALTPGTTNFECFGWNMWYDSDMDEVYEELKQDGFGFGLQIGFQRNCDVKATISQSLFKDEEDILNHPERNVVFLPGLDADNCSSSGSDTTFFHRNTEGFITFSKDEAERTSNYLSSIEFEERVKRQLQKKRFELPQEIGKVDGMFCNEAVYGKANILWVCGVIRLSDSIDVRSSVTDTTSASSQNNDFDVWPSREAKDIMVKYNEKWAHVMEEFAEWSDIQSTNDDEEEDEEVDEEEDDDRT